jgi:hypothetical protein
VVVAQLQREIYEPRSMMCRKAYRRSAIQSALMESHQGSEMQDCISVFQKLIGIQRERCRGAFLRE